MHKVVEIDLRENSKKHNETTEVIQMTADNCIYDHDKVIGFVYLYECFFIENAGMENGIKSDRAVHRTGAGIYDWDYIKSGEGILRRAATSEN